MHRIFGMFANRPSDFLSFIFENKSLFQPSSLEIHKYIAQQFSVMS